jgi:hypothetical protein
MTRSDLTIRRLTALSLAPLSFLLSGKVRPRLFLPRSQSFRDHDHSTITSMIDEHHDACSRTRAISMVLAIDMTS